ncbi:MAG TPA: decaprenyl-phosphate phosphoribosyltransferase [Candidatus Saccharimonadales bacterium]
MVLVQLLRPKQWIKNLLVLAPLIFAGRLTDGPSVVLAVGAMVGFSLLASSMYILNDVHDLEFDRQHPFKKFRALASGKITVEAAWSLAVGLLLAAIGITWWVGQELTLVALAYAGLIFTYSRYLKSQVVLDVLVVAVGFVLRALAGAVAIGVVFSPWLLVTTLFLALFLVLGKRRQELVGSDTVAHRYRPVLADYSSKMLDQLLVMVATASLVGYSLYCLWPDTTARLGSSNLIYTLPVVIYGLFRYFYLVYRRDENGDPTEMLYTDRPLLASVVLWGVLVVVIIYQ